MLSAEIESRRHAQSVEEQWLDTEVILFCKIFGLKACKCAYISHVADTRLLWIVAGFDLTRMEESRGS